MTPLPSARGSAGPRCGAAYASISTDQPLQLHEEYLARVTASESDIQFGIVLARRQPAGGLVRPAPHRSAQSSRRAGAGHWCAGRDWRRGLGVDASRLLVQYGFDTVNLNRIWLEVFEDNPAARRIYEKIGFRAEGTLRQHSFREGRWWDVLVMGLLAEEWRQKS